MKRLTTEILMSIFIFFSCVNSAFSFEPTKATTGYTTAVHSDLISLPESKEKIVVAVYKFRDQTGQYKPSTVGTSFSTAISQGATSMLIKALEDSKWFIPLEREGLPNLLNERQIIRSTRMQFQSEGAEEIPPLPPLLYAGVIFEGGIISYDTDIITGGFGAQYFGLGGSSKIRRDQVTIYLRAVSTKNGRVLKSISTSKSVLSKEVDIGIYRFVKFKRLLEMETGFTTNEPLQLCVLEAIEKAVFDMIVEGIQENLWALNDPEDFKSRIIQNYFKEKENSQFEADNYLTTNKKLSFGFNVATQKYTGDYPNSELNFSGDAFIRCGITHSFSLMLSGGIGELSNRDNFDTDILHSEIKGLFTLFPERNLTPYIFLGGGVINYWSKDKQGKIIQRNRELFDGCEPMIVTGVGAEYFFNKTFSVHTTWNHYFTQSDKLDGFGEGGSDDYFWNLGVGFSCYVF